MVITALWWAGVEFGVDYRGHRMGTESTVVTTDKWCETQITA